MTDASWIFTIFEHWWIYLAWVIHHLRLTALRAKIKTKFYHDAIIDMIADLHKALKNSGWHEWPNQLLVISARNHPHRCGILAAELGVGGLASLVAPSRAFQAHVSVNIVDSRPGPVPILVPATRIDGLGARRLGVRKIYLLGAFKTRSIATTVNSGPEGSSQGSALYLNIRRLVRMLEKWIMLAW